MAFKAAGTHVIISSQTPANPFRYHSTPVHALYAKAVAEKTGVTFLDHFSLTRDDYLGLGAAAVNEMLPSDGIHTTLAGAELVARSFVKGVLCAGPTNPLYPYVTADARLVSPSPLWMGASRSYALWRAKEILRRQGRVVCKGSFSINP